MDSSVLFIDASKLFQKNGNKNILLPEHQDKIMALYQNRQDEQYLAKLVKNDGRSNSQFPSPFKIRDL